MHGNPTARRLPCNRSTIYSACSAKSPTRDAEGMLYKLHHDLLFSILAVVTGGNSFRPPIPPFATAQVSFRSLILLLCSVPGINILSATIILAEIGRHEPLSNRWTSARMGRDVSGSERECR